MALYHQLLKIRLFSMENIQCRIFRFTERHVQIAIAITNHPQINEISIISMYSCKTRSEYLEKGQPTHMLLHLENYVEGLVKHPQCDHKKENGSVTSSHTLARECTSSVAWLLTISHVSVRKMVGLNNDLWRKALSRIN